MSHPEEESIRTPPPHHQVVHICFESGQGHFLSCSVVATGFGFEFQVCVLFYFDEKKNLN